jgi:hypothetical protein
VVLVCVKFVTLWCRLFRLFRVGLNLSLLELVRIVSLCFL